ncbi:MAG: signal peptidase I [Candidatus Portnoybacteria bacterium CG23_combo_of_CG06-09_8_20_14_all_37_13]|uniref:Signal peptidase I n=1 Tax=Candidatus Portnoybacteria bacterium CG23_combo_of_CG06-09_8_20_14_all_37_13 TaxID=1974819 RepID=A0A2G9YCV6_9BACT|nr:MAG: signal peptidase I [Candidatus Portnoybacteria bacterium CG23_combo_of_CG06-09_8_20_14_all_37_13]
MKSNFWKEFIKALIISVVLAFAIRYFLVQPFKVQGASMEPSFYANDYLIVDEFTPRFATYQRGDIVVFKHNSSFYIKRIIGLPGEKIEIKDNKIYINDLILNETYLIENTSGSININLQEDEYFVLGDNRDASSDSRSWGILDKSLIIGRVWLRLLPLSKIDKFNAPSYY